MAEVANETLISLGLAPSDPDKGMLAISQYANGGGITEHYLLTAMANALIKGLGKRPQFLEGLKSTGIVIPPSLERALSSEKSPHLMYDLLGALKAEYLGRIYIQPNNEFPSAKEIVVFADSVGAITTYAHPGDVLVSPTGNKKAEKFEDELLGKLFGAVEAKGLYTVTYMPSRNAPEQLRRIHELTTAHGMFRISRAGINRPCQNFDCLELR